MKDPKLGITPCNRCMDSECEGCTGVNISDSRILCTCTRDTHPGHEQKEGPMTTHSCWEVAEAVIGISRRVLLKGKPGTGKTFAATHLALKDDQEVYSITLTEETPMAEIRGHFVTKGGEFVWMDGPAIRAWKEGARLVLNEIDHASDDVLTFMYAIMDDPEYASVTLPTGETVIPAKGFMFIATMNGEIHDLPDALQDRLPVSIDITELNPEALEALPEDLRDPAKNTTLLSNNERSISIRAWGEYAILREELDPRMAADAVFGDAASDAILALNIAETASIPHDMEGVEVTEDDVQQLQGIQRVHKWVLDRISAGYGIPQADSILGELRYVLPANLPEVELIDTGLEGPDEKWRPEYTVTLTSGTRALSGEQVNLLLGEELNGS